MAGITGEDSPGGLFGGGSGDATTTATAEQSQLAAAASETAAAASAATASTQATNASNSASTASTQASNASSSATAAANSATAAAGSATTASGHKDTATTQANNASNYATAHTGTLTSGSAKAWALGGGSSFTVGTAVADGEYSAKQHATLASASASTASTQATNASNSASTATTKADTATTQANTATTKAGEAATSATNSASSATTASNKAADAGKYASHAEDSQFTLSDGSTQGYSALHYNAKAEDEKTAAAASASTASTQATNASNSASTAAGHVTTASNHATAPTGTVSAGSAKAWALGGGSSFTPGTAVSGGEYSAKQHATLASASASTASTQATNASNSASSAGTAQGAAEAARDAALAALDSFDDRYLGVKSSAPSVDNDGNALAQGALYFDSGTDSMKVYDGSNWLNAYASLSGALIATNNLSDLNNAGTARTNLGVAIGSDVQAYSSVLAGTQQSFTTALKNKLDGVATSANAYVHPNHSGEVTSSADGATVIADNIVDEANLKVSNSPTNGYFLSAQSGNTGGLTWAVPTDTQYSVGDGGLTQNNFTDADHNKLNGIEASADVTDATNVTAAGALMDSECTSLADVKALNQSLVTTSTAATFARLKLTQTTVAASGSATTLNFASANNFLVNMSADTTFTWSNLSGAVGCSGNIIIVQDGTGGRDFTLPSEAKTPIDGATIVQNTGANEISVLSYYVMSSSQVLVNYIGDFA